MLRKQQEDPEFVDERQHRIAGHLEIELDMNLWYHYNA